MGGSFFGREELGNLYAAMFARLHREGRERYASPPTPGSDPDMEIWLPLREESGWP